MSEFSIVYEYVPISFRRMCPLWVTLLGWHGAGKTTVGQSLSGSHPWLGAVRYVRGSRLLEDYIAAKRPGWEEVKRNKDMGMSASPDLTHRLLAEQIEALAEANVVLLDGFPKSRSEVDRTQALLSGEGVDLAILLTCSPTERSARIGERGICNRCGTVGQRGSADRHSCPKHNCGGLLSPRQDDRPEIVQRRNDGEPPDLLASYFRDRARFVEIDAERRLDEVLDEVVSVIGSRLGLTSQSPG